MALALTTGECQTRERYDDRDGESRGDRYSHVSGKSLTRNNFGANDGVPERQCHMPERRTPCPNGVDGTPRAAADYPIASYASRSPSSVRKGSTRSIVEQ